MLMIIRSLTRSDLSAVKDFTDLAIGKDYYSIAELEKIYDQSLIDGVMCTLVLEVAGEIKGIRISYPHGNWQSGKGRGLSPLLWPHPLQNTAYFQSAFLSPELTGQGLGITISKEALKRLQSVGAKGVVCHSWKESPGDSSGKYLRKLGFKAVAIHPEYWKAVDYVCTRCGKPCLCTSEEMYLDLNKL